MGLTIKKAGAALIRAAPAFLWFDYIYIILAQ
jgi:hypothetical protein